MSQEGNAEKSSGDRESSFELTRGDTSFFLIGISWSGFAQFAGDIGGPPATLILAVVTIVGAVALMSKDDWMRERYLAGPRRRVAAWVQRKKPTKRQDPGLLLNSNDSDPEQDSSNTQE